MVRAKTRISLIIQEGFLRSIFPGSIIKRNRESYISWIHTLTPSPISDSYKVKLECTGGSSVSFYVLEPKLKLAQGKKSLPHVYSTSEQKLCLYYPKDREWHNGLLYVKTIIPWACEWLLHYEIWVATGEWHGGGIHFTSSEKDAEAEKKKNENQPDK